MSDSGFPQDVRERFVTLAEEARFALHQLKKKMTLKDELAYWLAVLQHSHPSELLQTLPAKAIYEHNSFQNLLRFALACPPLRTRLVHSTRRNDDLDDTFFAMQSVKSYVQFVLLRTVCVVDFAAGHPTFTGTFEEFLDFLATSSVRRLVSSPLFRVDLEAKSYELGKFQLQKIALSDSDVEETLTQSSIQHGAQSLCALHFTVDTSHFTMLPDAPISATLKSYATILRLAAFPLVSYNHFHVQHVQPWEWPIADARFSARFWGHREKEVSMPPFLFSASHVEQAKKLLDNLARAEWDRLTPWRLAVDRLDDGVFKLECGSADAILDLVIGLESIFLEEDSRQESTHKVAARVARFLEDGEVARRETFRRVKELYRIRSTLAHGQSWELDEDGVRHVQSAAILLGRSLRRMLELLQTKLDLLRLDLS